MKTIKLPYKSEGKERILSYVNNFNSVLRFTYNRITDSEKGLSTKELTKFQKSMNNVFIDSHFKNSAIFKAKALHTRNPNKKILFGGKKIFEQRRKNTLSKEEFKALRYAPLCSIGEADKKGNRKFQIVSDSKILFKPNRKEHIELILPKLRNNYRKELLELMSFQNSKTIPITYELDCNYIYISYDLPAGESSTEKNSILKDRIFAIDLNPNYIGWSIVDWNSGEEYRLVASGLVSAKDLNDCDFSLKGKGLNSSSKERKYISNKRKHELVEISSYLTSLAYHYHCQIFSMEDLTIKSSNKEKGHKYNKLINNCWNRNLLTNQIEKRCKLLGLEFLKVKVNYSSFVGNLAYRRENRPDMILSSIEISRRGYEFYHQYIKKDKEKQKNIIFNESESNKILIKKSLEELKYEKDFASIEKLYKEIKTLNLRYRVSLNENLKFFSLKSNKSKINCYNYI